MPGGDSAADCGGGGELGDVDMWGSLGKKNTSTGPWLAGAVAVRVKRDIRNVECFLIADC